MKKATAAEACETTLKSQIFGLTFEGRFIGH